MQLLNLSKQVIKTLNLKIDNTYKILNTNYINVNH